MLQLFSKNLLKTMLLMTKYADKREEGNEFTKVSS